MLAGLGALERRLGGLPIQRGRGGLAHQLLLGGQGAPGLGAHASQRQAHLPDDAAFHLQDGGHRGEREGIGGPVPHLDVERALRGGQRGHVHREHQLAVLQHRLPLGRGARQQVEVGEGHGALPLGALDAHGGAQGGQGHAHVRGVGGDAGLTHAQHGVAAVDALQGRAARAGGALVTGRGGVAEVRAAGALHDVATHGGHVADLPRGARQQGLGEHRVALADERVVGHVAVARQGAQAHAPIGKFLDLGERQLAHVHQQGGGLHPELHQIQQAGATGEEARLLRAADTVHAGAQLLRLFIVKGMHEVTLGLLFREPPHLLNGGDDVGVGAAAAEVAAHGFTHVRVRGPAGLGQQPGRAHDLARGAVATLQGVLFNKGLLQGVQGVPVGQALHRLDLRALLHDGERQAAQLAPAIHEHRAGTALAVITALLGSGEPHALAQGIQQAGAGVHLQHLGLAVDLKGDLHLRGNGEAIGPLGRGGGVTARFQQQGASHRGSGDEFPPGAAIEGIRCLICGIGLFVRQGLLRMRHGTSVMTRGER
ncbi:hypothetical protein STIAU_8041 [Stigmatella aurantiaca DW4/3-1]|uniref:Uncharacterized protein n=1 Tax=Stigmatella aurantiaca (strain DW4/3-1) TaxID=378806 RepID=Q09BZ8_STIAD|nr:hypothetical protein STIAU_8041 [Stigmatella aurantiaca DW4/3-1]